jgi:hypothetical protein
MLDLRRHLKPKLLSFGRSFGIRCYRFQIMSSSRGPSTGKKMLNITLLMVSSSWEPSTEKKTPNSSPFVVLDHFFQNELIPRKIRRLLNVEGPKNTFPELVIKKWIKTLRRLPVHRSASKRVLAVRLLYLRGYINRRVGEKLPHHSLLLRRCAAKKLY